MYMFCAMKAPYDSFYRLMICLLFRKGESLNQIGAAVSRAKTTSEFQNSEERAVIATLDFWLEGALTRESAKPRKRPSKAAKVEKIDLNEAAKTLIAEARKALNEVEQEIVRARASDSR